MLCMLYRFWFIDAFVSFFFLTGGVGGLGEQRQGGHRRLVIGFGARTQLCTNFTPTSFSYASNMIITFQSVGEQWQELVCFYCVKFTWTFYVHTSRRMCGHPILKILTFSRYLTLLELCTPHRFYSCAVNTYCFFSHAHSDFWRRLFPKCF